MTKTPTRTSRWLPVLCALVVTWSSSAAAQTEAEAEARRVLEEAQAHDAEGRPAMAAESYLELYDVMRGAELPRAPIALWSAGLALSQLPGREQEAIDVLRRFLDESTTLTDDAQVRDWRSEAVTMIDELEARVPDEAPETDGDTPADSPVDEEPVEPTPSDTRTGISPVGPVILGIGGASLVVGLVVGAFSLSMDAEFRDACDDLSMCPRTLRPQYEEMRGFSTAADVLMVAGGAVALVGLVLTLTIREEQAPPISASCSHEGCLALVRGGF